MKTHTVLVTRQWTISVDDRRARIACDLALAQGADDEGLYEVCVTFNDTPLFERIFDRHDDALAAIDAMREDLGTMSTVR